jgi:hypothetical protein
VIKQHGHLILMILTQVEVVVLCVTDDEKTANEVGES